MHATLKSWEGPGDEANFVVQIKSVDTKNSLTGELREATEC